MAKIGCHGFFSGRTLVFMGDQVFGGRVGIQGIHLVGSVPLQDNTQVFTEAWAKLRPHIKRIPDGETGDRTNWIRWQAAVFEATPGLRGEAVPQPQFSIVPGQTPQFGNLGYRDAALASYEVFSQLKAQDTLPEAVRFQVSLPTPLAPVQLYFAAESRAEVEPFYEAQLMSELQDIVDAIPHDQLAVQWDTAVEFGVLEGVFPAFFDNPLQEIVGRLERLGRAVPDGVELGYHLCYGDAGHQHFVEPTDATWLVRVANEIAASLDRSLQWLHLPVPKSRCDDAYFAPLRSLQLQPTTELYLGLVHHSDGLAGDIERAATATNHVASFGVATECGFGRRPAEQVASLMTQHVDIIDNFKDRG